MSQASNRTIKRSQGRSLARHAGVLSAKHRNKLPKSEARATQMANSGKLSASTKAKIDAKANRILGGGKSND